MVLQTLILLLPGPITVLGLRAHYVDCVYRPYNLRFWIISQVSLLQTLPLEGFDLLGPGIALSDKTFGVGT